MEHYMLFVRFICVVTATVVLGFTRSRAEITPIVDLAPDQLIGPWEAIVQHQGTVGSSIYQILFLSPNEAWLAQAASDSHFSVVQFIGRLASENLTNGQIKLEFTAVQGRSESDYVSIQIEGIASGSANQKIIEGKIVKKTKDGRVTSDPVLFAKTLWTRSIVESSVAAEKAIRDARQQNQSDGK